VTYLINFYFIKMDAADPMDALKSRFRLPIALLAATFAGSIFV